MKVNALTTQREGNSFAATYGTAGSGGTVQLRDNRPASLARHELNSAIQRVAKEMPGATSPSLQLKKVASYQASSPRQFAQTQHTAAVGKVAQLAKYSLKGVQKHKSGHWYSPANPYKVYPTKAAAEIAHKATNLKYKGKFEAATSIKSFINKKKGHKIIAKHSTTLRAYTLYTYMLTKAQNVLSIAVQGPHTVAHRVTASALLQTSTITQLDNIFTTQIPSPAQIDAILNVEKSNPTPAEQERIARFKADYKQAYDGYKELSQSINNKTSKGLTRPKHLINHLLNMHPYATYSWKSGKKASKKNTKGKGESVRNPKFSDLCDTSSAAFTDKIAYQGFINTRKLLFTAYPPQ